MSDFLSLISRLLLFCTIMPGATAFLLIVLLYQNCFRSDIPAIEVAGWIWGLGIIANGLGHALEQLLARCKRCRCCNGKGWEHYGWHFAKMRKDGSPGAERLRTYIDYAILTRIWYWNTAVGIAFVLLARAADSWWNWSSGSISGFWTVVSLSIVLLVSLGYSALGMGRRARKLVEMVAK